MGSLCCGGWSYEEYGQPDEYGGEKIALLPTHTRRDDYFPDGERKDRNSRERPLSPRDRDQDRDTRDDRLSPRGTYSDREGRLSPRERDRAWISPRNREREDRRERDQKRREDGRYTAMPPDQFDTNRTKRSYSETPPASPIIYGELEGTFPSITLTNIFFTSKIST